MMGSRWSGAYWIGSWGLGTTGLPCHDDLVHRQDGPGGLCCELDCPALGDHQVQDAGILGVQNSSVLLVLLMLVSELHMIGRLQM